MTKTTLTRNEKLIAIADTLGVTSLKRDQTGLPIFYLDCNFQGEWSVTNNYTSKKRLRDGYKGIDCPGKVIDKAYIDLVEMNTSRKHIKNLTKKLLNR